MNASKSIAASQYPMRATACFDSGLHGYGNLRYHSRKSSPSCGAGIGVPNGAVTSRYTCESDSGFFVSDAPNTAARTEEVARLRRCSIGTPTSFRAATFIGVKAGSNSTVTGAFIMTNALTPFNFGQFTVSTTTTGDAVWFSAADVCSALGIKNHRDSLQHLDADEKGVVSTDTLGGQQKVSVVNESGLYALVLRSRKPEARKFAKWVTSEVLPAIRKTGGYQQPVNIHAAMTAANAVAAQVQAAVFEKLMTGNSRMGNGRWMLSFSSGRDDTTVPCVTPIDDDAFVMSLAYLATAIMAPGGMMPSNTDLANLASACNKRLSAQLTYEASRKAVTA